MKKRDFTILGLIIALYFRRNMNGYLLHDNIYNYLGIIGGVFLMIYGGYFAYKNK